MKTKKPKKSGKPIKGKNLWANPSYRNMLNPYESKYPQGKASGSKAKKKP